MQSHFTDETKRASIVARYSNGVSVSALCAEHNIARSTLIYMTNAVEGFHRMLRKFTKTKSIYPTDDSIRGITKKWTMPVRGWGVIRVS